MVECGCGTQTHESLARILLRWWKLLKHSLPHDETISLNQQNPSKSVLRQWLAHKATQIRAQFMIKYDFIINQIFNFLFTMFECKNEWIFFKVDSGFSFLFFLKLHFVSFRAFLPSLINSLQDIVCFNTCLFLKSDFLGLSSLVESSVLSWV